MLIDTCHIDRLRVNFVAHFNTENNAITAANEITTLIDNYPREMTTQVRQWLNEQHKSRLTTLDISKSIDTFEEYLKELEENMLQYEQNESNQIKFKVILFNMFFFKQNFSFLETSSTNRKSTKFA
jgi:hypothetical protein